MSKGQWHTTDGHRLPVDHTCLVGRAHPGQDPHELAAARWTGDIWAYDIPDSTHQLDFEPTHYFKRPPMTDERGEGMGGGRVAADELRLLIERAERLEEEKRGIADDIRTSLAEAKSRGYDTKAIKAIIRIRKMKREDYQEQEAVLETYLNAMGML